MGNLIKTPKYKLLDKIGINIKKDGYIFFNNVEGSYKSKIIIIDKFMKQVVPIWYKRNGCFCLTHILDLGLNNPIIYKRNKNVITINLYE
jgi:hypothetical protein